MSAIYDKTGREIRLWDVLKVFHFTGPRRKAYYMYKQVVGYCGTTRGESYCVVSHLLNPEAPNYNLRMDGLVHNEIEIVQGYEGSRLGESFEDRQRVKLPAKSAVAALGKGTP